MKIVKIISQHKKAKGHFNYITDANGKISSTFVPAVRIKRGFKRVEAIVSHNGLKRTRHIDIPI